jgi:hypothetical protein
LKNQPLGHIIEKAKADSQVRNDSKILGVLGDKEESFIAVFEEFDGDKDPGYQKREYQNEVNFPNSKSSLNNRKWGLNE